MRILALETATRGGSVALFDAEHVDARSGDGSRTHGERLPGELIDLLADRGCSIADVDLFAIVAGPGSFTGLRVGMACIQGLAMAADKKVVPIPTLDALAAAWQIDAKASAPGSEQYRESAAVRSVIACLDGQRDDVFYAAWTLTGDQPIEDAAPLVLARVGPASDLLKVANDVGQSAILVQQGLDRHADVLAALRLPVVTTKTPLAAAAARIGARRFEAAVRPHALRPIYIRRPDAVLARERAGLTSGDRVGS